MLSSMHGLWQSCVVRPSSAQGIIAIKRDPMHGSGCDYANVELHVVVSANI